MSADENLPRAKDLAGGAARQEAERVAGELAEQAKAAGATGARVTMAQRRLRDSAIIAAIQAGAQVKDVAGDFEITTRHVRRIMAADGKMPSALDERPMELVEDLLRGYRRLIADFEAMADYYRDTHPSTALRAKRGAVDVRERMQGLLLVIGKLPSNLELFRAEEEMTRVAHAMVGHLRRLEAGEVSASEVLVEWRRLIAPVGSAGLGRGGVIDGKEVADGR